MLQLRHKNVLPVVTVFENPRPVIVTKWLDGGTLTDFLKMELRERGPLSWMERGKAIALDIASGLEYLHEEMIIHRDLKSLNVFLDQHGSAVIADFGFAKGVESTSLKLATSMMGSYQVSWLLVHPDCISRFPPLLSSSGWHPR